MFLSKKHQDLGAIVRTPNSGERGTPHLADAAGSRGGFTGWVDGRNWEMRGGGGMGRVLALSLWIFGVSMVARADDAKIGSGEAGLRLHQIFRREWEKRLQDQPETATVYGFKRFNHQWNDVSLEALARRDLHRQNVLRELDKLETHTLSRADQRLLAIFRAEYENEVDSYKWRLHLLPLNQLEGLQNLSLTADAIAFDSAADYEAWLQRLLAFPQYVEQTIELMRVGIKSGRVQPRVAMRRVPPQLRRLVEITPERHPFYKPFRHFPQQVSEAARMDLRQRGQTAITNSVIPAYRKLMEFVERDYLPACYTDVGVWRLPDGRDLYTFQVRQQAGTAKSANDIHQIGLAEVRRIRAEMEKVMRQVGFEGSFVEFVTQLRSDPKFYFKNPDDILSATRDICARVDQALPRLFGRVPRTRYLIEPIPAHMAPDSTSAYYHWPSADGRRPGTYYINLHKPDARPKYQMEALSLHECMPGHHLQIALAYEQDNLPAFRRYAMGYNAYVEGWALYSESLGEQLGMYRDPYSKFGQLSYEIWRAVRLVVDTGMHSKQWTRRQALEFAVANSASALADIENEIDRYATWPGQALGYKLGELQIKSLRDRAHQELGTRFDLRSFHDTILATGPVPLDILEKIVEEWIEQCKK